MKKFKHLFWAILLIGIVSCSDETPSPSNEDSVLTEDVTFQLEGEIKSVGLKEHYQTIIKEASAGNDEESEMWLAYAQAQLDSADLIEKEYINQAGANWDQNADGSGNQNRHMGYEYATIRYKSIDHNGNDVMLSSLVVWPFNNIIADPDADHVIIGCHVTIGSNAERPSNYSNLDFTTDVGMLASCAMSLMPGVVYENLVIIPDYQGYGATHGEIHPYLTQDLTARQVIDGVRAGIKFYTEHLKHKLEDNWTSLSAGYSQGGAGAIRAVTEFANSDRYTTLFTCSAASREIADALNWSYDPYKIHIPYFMVAGTGISDAGDGKDGGWVGVTPLVSLEENYLAMPDDIVRVMARRIGAEHEDMMACSDAYLTAWMLYRLYGDEQAAEVFVGASAELRNNELWQDVALYDAVENK